MGEQGIVQRLAGSAAFAKVAWRVLPPLDRALHRATGGRRTLAQRVVPSLMLHTTGARTGLARDTPLACLPDGGACYVVGSNWGRPDHPAWTANLLAHPDAAVTRDGVRIEVRARLLDAREAGEVWPRLLRIWPAWASYSERAQRELRVFRLEPRLP